MSWSDFAEQFYNNQYTKYAQVIAPAALRIGLNAYTGQSLGTGMPIAVLLGAISYSHMPTFEDGFSNEDALVDEENKLYWLVLQPIKHQLMSCLFYSVLSSFGFNTHLTEFASKMCVTFIYSSRFKDIYENGAVKATIIFDLSRCFLGYTGLYNAFDGSADMHCLMSLLSQIGMLAIISAIFEEDGISLSGSEEDFLGGSFIEEVFCVTLMNVLAYPASAWLLPVEGASPIIGYTKDVPEAITAFISATVSAFTESGISI